MGEREGFSGDRAAYELGGRESIAPSDDLNVGRALGLCTSKGPCVLGRWTWKRALPAVGSCGVVSVYLFSGGIEDTSEESNTGGRRNGREALVIALTGQ